MLTSDSRRLERADKLKCQTQPNPGTLRITRGPLTTNEKEILEKLSRERFIRVGTALGVGAACASLVACGGGAASSGGGSGGGKSGGGDSGGGSQASTPGSGGDAGASDNEGGGGS